LFKETGIKSETILHQILKDTFFLFHFFLERRKPGERGNIRRKTIKE